MPEENKYQSVDISQARATTEKPEEKKEETTTATQTEDEETEETTEGATSTEDTESTENADEGQGEDKPDADGMYTHPDTKAKVKADEMVVYYKGKFGMSTSGAQQLLKEKETLTGTVAEKEQKLLELAKEIETLRQVAEGKNPEGLNLVDLQASAKKNAEEVALLREERSLDTFEKANPLASTKREALRSLARANPQTPLQTLWDANLKAGAEAEAKAAKDKKITQKKNAGDKGKGTSTRDPAAKTIGGYTQEEFNKLPVEKRKAIFAKEGIV